MSPINVPKLTEQSQRQEIQNAFPLAEVWQKGRKEGRKEGREGENGSSFPMMALVVYDYTTTTSGAAAAAAASIRIWISQ